LIWKENVVSKLASARVARSQSGTGRAYHTRPTLPPASGPVGIVAVIELRGVVAGGEVQVEGNCGGKADMMDEQDDGDQGVAGAAKETREVGEGH